MKKHLKIIRNLSAYLDKELNNKAMMLIDNHLNNCVSCNAELDLLKKTSESLNSYPEIEPSFYFNTKLQQKINENKKKTGWSKIILDRIQWAPIFTMIILMVFILFQVSFFALTVSAKGYSIKNNVKTIAIKELIFSPRLLNISSLLNFCDSCYNTLCKCNASNNNCCDIKGGK